MLADRKDIALGLLIGMHAEENHHAGHRSRTGRSYAN